ncbi:MAG: HD-GYP domain-containing protein, partial [Actinomycetota bacterium]
GSHSSRVADYASEIARQLGFEGRELIRVRLTALMHDIGKVGLPPEAMQESDDLEGYSLEAYRSHPERGSRYVRLTAGTEVADAIRSHHENWDGTGFPEGLKGEEIPMTARIIAVANTFDILTTMPQDPSNVPLTRKEAIAKLRTLVGTKFESVMVEAAEVALSR